MKSILTSSNLESHSNLIHGFTTRAIADDFEKIAAAHKIASGNIFALKQIHSDIVICLDEHSDLQNLPEGDALVTNQKNILIGVRTADCLPILICDKAHHAIAAVHAGWRGLVKGIVLKTLHTMMRRYGSTSTDLEIVFGPCLGVKNFEVGDEVVAAFQTAFGERFVWDRGDRPVSPTGKPHIDLTATARLSCTDNGCRADSMAHIDLCTFERSDLFYSYRRERGTGRQFNFIGMV